MPSVISTLWSFAVGRLCVTVAVVVVVVDIFVWPDACALPVLVSVVWDCLYYLLLASYLVAS